MSPLETLGFALGTSFASGLNVYATVAAAGIMQRLGLVNLPESLQVLTHPIVLGLAVTLFVIEFIADKIPYVDSVWDAIHTLVRPAAAAGLGWGIFNTQPATMQAIAALLAGTVALTSHGAKATTRAAANTSPEPFSNIILSVIEDVLAAGLTWLAMAHPVVTAFIVVVLLGLAVLIIRGLVRFFKRTLGSPPASATS